MRLKLALAGFVLVAICLLGFLLAGRSVYSRAAFGTWDPTAMPARISYCDRRYYAGSHVTRAQIDAQANAFGTFPLKQVGTTASGAAIVAKPLSESERRNHGSVTLPCAMVVYVKLNANDYVAYGLSGGP